MSFSNSENLDSNNISINIPPQAKTNTKDVDTGIVNREMEAKIKEEIEQDKVI